MSRIKKTSVEILDMMIDAMPENMRNNKKFSFYLSNTILKKLCKELGRNVKTYKKYKVYNSSLIADEKSYLM